MPINLKQELKKLSKNEVIKFALQLSALLDQYIVKQAVDKTEESKNENDNK